MEMLSKGQCVFTPMNGYGFIMLPRRMPLLLRTRTMLLATGNMAPKVRRIPPKSIVRRPSMRSYIIPKQRQNSLLRFSPPDACNNSTIVKSSLKKCGLILSI